MADADFQITRGGGAGGVGAGGGHPDPEIREEEPGLKKKIFFGPSGLSLVLK